MLHCVGKIYRISCQPAINSGPTAFFFHFVTLNKRNTTDALCPANEREIFVSNKSFFRNLVSYYCSLHIAVGKSNLHMRTRTCARAAVNAGSRGHRHKARVM
jgi:hypothetical protein